jgi:hypothetical protein
LRTILRILYWVFAIIVIVAASIAWWFIFRRWPGSSPGFSRGFSAAIRWWLYDTSNSWLFRATTKDESGRE